MSEAFICEGTRTPIGKFGGSLSSIRTDDLASLPLISLKEMLKALFCFLFIMIIRLDTREVKGNGKWTDICSWC